MKFKDYGSLRNLLFSDYKYIFSLGSFCYTRMLLNAMGLDQFAGPFDWSASYDHNKNGIGGICGKIDRIFLSPERVFVKDKLLECKVDNSTLPNQTHKCYVNLDNGFEYLHDFYKSMDDCGFENELLEVNEKYERRFKRMQECIVKQDKVLFVYIYEGERINLTNGKLVYEFGNSDFPLSSVLTRIEKLNTDYPNVHFLLLLSDKSFEKMQHVCQKKGLDIYGGPSYFTLMNNLRVEPQVLSAFYDFGNLKLVSHHSFLSYDSYFGKIGLLGFCKPEEFGVWTQGDYSIIAINSEDEFSMIVLNAFPFLCIEKEEVNFDVYVDDTFVRSFTHKLQKGKEKDDLLLGRKLYLLKLDRSYRTCNLSIRFKEPVCSPSSYNYNMDKRKIGLCLTSIYLLSD